MDFSKTLRTVIGGIVGLGLGLGAACVVHEATPPPQQPGQVGAGAQQPGTEGQTSALADGWYYCHFNQDNTDYKRYYCRVYSSSQGQHIVKVGGFETFAGNLAATQSGVRLDGRGDCKQMGTNCRGTFTVALVGQGREFRGQVQQPGWWLHNATLNLQFISSQAPHDAMGGAGYGGHAYGGAGYGGHAYGGAGYGGHSYGGATYGHP